MEEMQSLAKQARSTGVITLSFLCFRSPDSQQPSLTANHPSQTVRSFPPTDARASRRQGVGLNTCTVNGSLLESFFDLVLFVCFHSGWYCLALCLHTNSMTSSSEYSLTAPAQGMVLRDPVKNRHGFCPMVLN